MKSGGDRPHHSKKWWGPVPTVPPISYAPASITQGHECSLHILEKTGETKIMHIITKVGEGEFYENIDPTFLLIVTAGKSRDLIMHVGCLHCIVFLSQMHRHFFTSVPV